MKKKHILMTTLLLSSQILLPLSGFAETNSPEHIPQNQLNESEQLSTASDTILSGVNGTSSWTYDNGTLTFSGGDLTTKISQMTEFDPQTVTKIDFSGKVTIPSLYSKTDSFFANLSNLVGIDNGGNLDFSNVSEPYYLFRNDSKLEYIDTSQWDTRNMIRTTGMFLGCSNLKTLDVSNWNMSNVIDLGNMFNGCNSIDNLDVSNWDTSQVTNLDKTFFQNINLSTLNVTSWNTSKVTIAFATFMGCQSLEELDISQWDVSQVTSADSMLKNLTHVKKLDVSNWNVSKMKNMGGLFDGDQSITELDLSKWDAQSATNTNDLFNHMVSLKKLSFSPNLKVVDGSNDGSSLGFNLPDIQASATFTGKWQNVGSGTSDKPLGNFVLDSRTLSKGTPSTDVETFVWQPVADTETTLVPIYRAYNPNDGDHLYTKDLGEYDGIIGLKWSAEGTAFQSVLSDYEGSVPVYRLYNTNSGEHFYTISEDEYNNVASAGWSKEQIGFYMVPKDKGDSVYRVFNPNATGPGSHLYTSDKSEADGLINKGWMDEGIAFYSAK